MSFLVSRLLNDNEINFNNLERENLVLMFAKHWNSLFSPSIKTLLQIHTPYLLHHVPNWQLSVCGAQFKQKRVNSFPGIRNLLVWNCWEVLWMKIFSPTTIFTSEYPLDWFFSRPQSTTRQWYHADWLRSLHMNFGTPEMWKSGIIQFFYPCAQPSSCKTIIFNSSIVVSIDSF